MVSNCGERHFAREIAMGFWSFMSGRVLLEDWPWERRERRDQHGREERE